MRKLLTGLWCCFLCVQMVMANDKPNATKFSVTGYHIDLRVQVIKMPALKAFVAKLKNNGINTIIMEWEAAYPFEKYPVIANQYSYTKNELNKRFLELNKNTFYLAELETENTIRSQHIQVLYNRLSKNRSLYLTGTSAAR